MSLLRLLTTGKSLVGGRDTEIRYRASGERLLPHFGSAKNPFSSTVKSEPVPAGGRPPAACVENGASSGSEIRSASREPAQARPRGVWHLKAFAILCGWASKIGGRLYRPRAIAIKSAIPRFAKPPVQGELSLDKIKVVRNDLSDADLEVVAAKLPVAPAVEQDLRAEATVVRGTASFLGAGKT
jgi:hypothetical protein